MLYRSLAATLSFFVASILISCTGTEQGNQPGPNTDDLFSQAAQNITGSVGEDGSVNLTLLAEGLDPANLSLTIVDQPKKGTVTVLGTGGTAVRMIASTSFEIKYVPNENENGSDSFSYLFSDGVRQSNVGTVQINIFADNDTPVAENSSLNTNEDQAVSGQLVGSDADGDALIFSILSQPNKGIISNFDTSTGSFLYTPSLNESGADSLTFNVRDAELTSETKTVSINIANINDAPVAQDGSLNTIEDTAVNGQLFGFDADGDTLVFSVVSNPSKGEISNLNPSTGFYTYTPNQNASGADSFTYRVSDSVVTSSVKTISVDLSNVNDAPVAQNSSITTTEDVAVSGTLMATDPDGDSLTFSLVVGAGDGNVVLQPNGSFTYTPNLNFSGSDTFHFKVQDGSLFSNTGIVSITVNTDYSDAPTAQRLSAEAVPGQQIVLQGVGSDPNNLPLTYHFAYTPYDAYGENPWDATASINQQTGAITFTAASHARGMISFAYRVYNGQKYSQKWAYVDVLINRVDDISGNLELPNGIWIISNAKKDGDDCSNSAISIEKGTALILGPQRFICQGHPTQSWEQFEYPVSGQNITWNNIVIGNFVNSLPQIDYASSVVDILFRMGSSGPGTSYTRLGGSGTFTGTMQKK